MVYIYGEFEMLLKRAKVFKNGRSQAVRLPKEFRVNTDEVFIRKHGDEIIITTKEPTWEAFFRKPSSFGKDFNFDRENEPPQERDGL
jgi:antitoxin VapB